MFIEHLLCARYSSRCWEQIDKKHFLDTWSLYSSGRERLSMNYTIDCVFTAVVIAIKETYGVPEALTGESRKGSWRKWHLS